MNKNNIFFIFTKYVVLGPKSDHAFYNGNRIKMIICRRYKSNVHGMMVNGKYYKYA